MATKIMAFKCLLNDPECKENCDKCGWNSVEVKYRERLFKKNGLTTCKKGLRRLIIKREDSED